MSNVIRVGDRTTAGGVVLDGVGSVTTDGRPISFNGARVSCPKCGSIGFARSLPHPTNVVMNGMPLLQAGDQCVCNCPPPALVASQGMASLNHGGSIQPYQYAPIPASGDATQLAGSEGTPRNNQAQNRQFKAVVRVLGLNKDQARQLHDEISKKGLGYQEMLERGRDLFGDGDD